MIHSIEQTVEGNQCHLSIKHLTAAGAEGGKGLIEIKGRLKPGPGSAIKDDLTVGFSLAFNYMNSGAWSSVKIYQQDAPTSGLNLPKLNELLAISTKIISQYSTLLNDLFDFAGEPTHINDYFQNFSGRKSLSLPAVILAAAPVLESKDALLGLFRGYEVKRSIERIMTALDRDISGENPLRDAFVFAMNIRGHEVSQDDTKSLVKLLDFYVSLAQ